jgi:putative ferrous iron transport protein C
MSLLDIKNHLMQVKIASLASLCVYFNCRSDVLRGMLALWVQKGKIRSFTKTAACGSSCSKCSAATTEIYEWVGVAQG